MYRMTLTAGSDTAYGRSGTLVECGMLARRMAARFGPDCTIRIHRPDGTAINEHAAWVWLPRPARHLRHGPDDRYNRWAERHHHQWRCLCGAVLHICHMEGSWLRYRSDCGYQYQKHYQTGERLEGWTKQAHC